MVFCNQWANGIHYILTLSEQKRLVSHCFLDLMLGRILFAKWEGGTEGLGI